MAYAFVKQAQNSATASGTSLVATFGSNVTSGNLLIAICGYTGGDASVTITDGASNSWTEVVALFVNGGVGRVRVFYKENATGAFTAVTATYDAAIVSRHLYVAEYSGIAAASAYIGGVYADHAAPGTGLNAVTSGNLDITSQPALSFAWGMDGNADTGPPASGTGYASRGTGLQFGTGVDFARIEDKPIASTGNNAATFTGLAGSHTYAVYQLAFAEATAGAVKFRRTLSARGTGSGKRQVQF